PRRARSPSDRHDLIVARSWPRSAAQHSAPDSWWSRGAVLCLRASGPCLRRGVFELSAGLRQAADATGDAGRRTQTFLLSGSGTRVSYGRTCGRTRTLLLSGSGTRLSHSRTCGRTRTFLLSRSGTRVSYGRTCGRTRTFLLSGSGTRVSYGRTGGAGASSSRRAHSTSPSRHRRSSG